MAGGGAAPASSASTAVTKIVDRIPRPGMTAQLEQAIRALTAAAVRFPGHLGVTVTRPSLPVQPGFRLVYHFDTCDHLRDWETSSEYARLVEVANRFTQGEPVRTTMSGLEAWFTLPGEATPPPKGRVTLMTWFGIFPLVYLFATLAAIILPPSVPVVVRLAIVTGLVVPAMSYLVGPLLTRMFHRWLHPA
jgi:antibiotic biosynthesis monooxygenase (ABM) superfamily enzyme